MAGGASRNAKEKLAKLKTEEQVVLKSCKASLNAIKLCDQQLASDVAIVAGELENTRKHEKNKINQDVADIYEELAAIQTLIKDDDCLLECSPRKCKERLMHIQNKIVQSRHYLEKEIFILKNEEKVLFEEVLIAQQRVEDTSKYDEVRLHPNHKFAYSKVLKQIDKTKNDNHAKDKDIEIFEKFVEHNGHCGGWNEQDHLLFLRLKSKYHKHNDAKFFSALLGQLPDLTAEKIADHATWFEEYENLREKNKVAIQKWREARKIEKKKDNDEIKSSTSSLNGTDVSEKRKSEIAEWKRQKEVLHEQKKEQERNKIECEKTKLKVEREKQLKIREEIEMRRQARKAREQEEKIEMQHFEEEIRKEKAGEAREMIKIYRQLDELHVEKLKLMRIKKQDKKELPPVPDGFTAERNPDRLLQMTKVWKARCKVEEDDEKPAFPHRHLHLRNIPHLGVPEWRRGVN